LKADKKEITTTLVMNKVELSDDREVVFWKKLAWGLTSCDEAVGVFPEMYVCPVCQSRIEIMTDEYGDQYETMVHKNIEDLFN